MRLHASNMYFLIFYVLITVFLFVQFQKHTKFSEDDLIGVNPIFQQQVIPVADKKLEFLKNCGCKSTVTGKLYDFCYKLPEDEKSIGKKFDCKFVEEWEKIESSTKFVDLQNDSLPEPVFVTAFNNPFIRNGKRLISSIRRLGFHNKIILYNLGIEKENLKALENSCILEIRHFNFTKYPGYVRNLKSYRWKPIVIAETLREFGAIWYLDSSVVFEKKNVSHIYDLVTCHGKVNGTRAPLLSSSARDLRESREPHESGWNLDVWKRNLNECRKGQYLLHGYSGHGILSATNPAVYKYFPTNPAELKKPKAKMYDAGFVYAVATRQTMLDIVKWYFLCALQEDCMAPKDAVLRCTFENGDRFSSYAGCHRYDQSIINLVLANQFWYDRRYYVSEIVDFFHIDRSGSIGQIEDQRQCI
ncbi:Nucleotide-diphospho-sugar transferase domain-containing protein [Caenorhabditis elegans]|uniref:Nucleotide-diphospho-sugar transferase domain-containing protein n=1 Tax=Caenorhabditis elegans TaxID=6239 RepID=Q9XV45_CAEEL|nr:Nucleotide-diphospho-sugar transferase domain-containing protein [Caenorhabditis elegans]CAB04238.1 Nucleotide-diphospho-sugar transferase domain-containing protein [Caenorhabditis elegans]|eukprot:NP_492940.1 Uncharacterized protein CELE_F32B4.1 [Caenorhabditis elegans]